MKKSMISILSLVLATYAFSQATKPDVHISSEQYLKTSHIEKATGLALVGIGTLGIGAGLTIAFQRDGNPLYDLTGEVIGTTLFLGGAVLDLISIPFFIDSAKNKTRGMEATASIKLQAVSSFDRSNTRQTKSPGLGLEIRF